LTPPLASSYDRALPTYRLTDAELREDLDRYANAPDGGRCGDRTHDLLLVRHHDPSAVLPTTLRRRSEPALSAVLIVIV